MTSIQRLRRNASSSSSEVCTPISLASASAFSLMAATDSWIRNHSEELLWTTLACTMTTGIRGGLLTRIDHDNDPFISIDNNNIKNQLWKQLQVLYRQARPKIAAFIKQRMRFFLSPRAWNLQSTPSRSKRLLLAKAALSFTTLHINSETSSTNAKQRGTAIDGTTQALPSCKFGVCRGWISAPVVSQHLNGGLFQCPSAQIGWPV